MTYTPIADYSIIQTFYADSEIVGGSNDVSVTSLNLYFKKKPDAVTNASGKPAPGVVVALCEMINDSPDLSRCYSSSLIRRSYDEIFSFSDSSAATTFGFNIPVRLKTNAFYGIVIIFEDPGYELWVNKRGDKLVGTNSASSGSNMVKDGKLFLYNNSNIFNAISDTDLKFNLSVAKFSSNTITEVYTNKDYEFLTLSSLQGDFIGGEYVYKLVANSTGNVEFSSGSKIISGVGTDFTTIELGSTVVLYSNTTSGEVGVVSEVVNSTSMILASNVSSTNSSSKYMVSPVGSVYYKDRIQNKLFLTNSTANSTLKFNASDVIVGAESKANASIVSVDNFSVDALRVHADTIIPAASRVTTSTIIANYDGSTYVFNSNNTINLNLNTTETTHITNWDTHILSRSNEVGLTLYSNTDLVIDNKSMKVDVQADINLPNTALYSSPSIDRGKLDVYVTKYNISNTTAILDANSVSIDSEVDNSGSSLSRHISSKLTFANNKFAEDLKVFITAYRPPNTDIHVYARLHNSIDSDAFDDKSWTPLTYTENQAVYSSVTNRSDFIEYTLGLPAYSESANVIPGTFTSQLANNVIVATGSAPSSYVVANDLVKIYNPLISEDYAIAVVSSANSTSITLGSPISNNNVVGTGFKVDRLKYYNTAFNNVSNDNICRYYNSSLVEFDTFDTVQLKIVFTSDTTYIVPRVNYYQVIGVSA